MSSFAKPSGSYIRTGFTFCDIRISKNAEKSKGFGEYNSAQTVDILNWVSDSKFSPKQVETDRRFDI